MHKAKPIYALVDGNAFFANCEKIFNPKLKNVPVLVLSSGDGNVVARCPLVRQLGIKMGQPFHEIRDLVKRHNVACFSSNFSHYASISNRFMEILRGYTPVCYQYSVDEMFLLVSGMSGLWESPTVMGHHIRQRTLQWISLPVCVGYAPSQVLAKAANHIAKKDDAFEGVCDLSSMKEDDINDLLDQYSVLDTWGVGTQIGQRLLDAGIKTMGALRRTPTRWLRQQFGVVMERLGLELKGYSCLQMEEIPQPKKQIIASRSFGTMITDQRDLAAAVSTFTAIAAEKLRRQNSVCGALHVFVSTNRFRPNEPQYANGITIPLSEPTGDTRRLTAAALFGLKHIYRAGPYRYKKAGIILMDISSAQTIQKSLFYSDEARSKSEKAMEALDAINEKFGRGTVRVASAASSTIWTPRADHISKKYTTDWEQIPIVYAR
jgi:DNA polymerase V